METRMQRLLCDQLINDPAPSFTGTGGFSDYYLTRSIFPGCSELNAQENIRLFAVACVSLRFPSVLRHCFYSTLLGCQIFQISVFT